MKLVNVSEVELVYRPKVKLSELPQIRNSLDVFGLLTDIWKDDICYIERFYVLFLNNSNRILGYKMLAKGSQVSCIIEIKTLFQSAILMHCAGVVIAHNHPSGNKKPSEADINLTKRIKNGLDIFDIKLLDHVIMCDDDFYSFSDNSMI